MILRRYSDFRRNYNSNFGGSLNENLQQAKTYIRNIALKDKKTRTGEEGAALTSEEVRRADNNPSFLKVLDLVKDAQPLAYVFTKFFFEDLSEIDETERLSELKTLLDKLKRLRSLLPNLPMQVDRYVSKAAVEEEEKNSKEEDRQYRTPFERLGDDLTKLEGGVITNKWINQLLSWQKTWMTKLSTFQKEKVDGIAKAFDEFGTEDNVKDKDANKSLQRMFFQSVLQYKTLDDLLLGAINFIKAANNASQKKFLIAIDKVNSRFGFNNGAEVIFNKGSILIIEVKSYPANVELNANTSHCITKSPSSWETYVGLDKFTKQYYIYDFDLPPNDNHSVIGITIGEKGAIRACHLKNDAGFGTNVVSYMKKKGVDMNVMPPLDAAEIEQRKKRIVASKEIVKPNLTLDQIKTYLEAGADPNTSAGKPLENAVKEESLEKTRNLLESGAMPMINNPIKFAKSYDMIKLLVEFGCALTPEVFNSIINDIDAVKFVLEKGFDPNFEKGYPLRAAVRVNNPEVIKLLVQTGAKIDERRYMVVKQCVESGFIEILQFLLTELQKSDLNFKNTDSRGKLLNEWKNWNQTSLQTKPEVKQEIITILDSFQ